MLAAHSTGSVVHRPGSLEPVINIVPIAGFSERSIEFQEARIGHAPFIGENEELPLGGTFHRLDRSRFLDVTRHAGGNFPGLGGRVGTLGGEGKAQQDG